MRKGIIPVILAAGVLVLPVLFTGCGLFGFTRDKNLKALEGRWYDVNGDTTLDFHGNQMTVSFGERLKEGYRVRVTNTPVKYIECASENKYGGRDFGGMSVIEIMEDGRVLSAQEMILDAEGHIYRFVREEDLEKEKAFEDLSKDLPKTVESDELTEFSLSFSLEDTRFDVPADMAWETGSYAIEAEKEEDGYHFRFRAMGQSYVIYDYEGIVSEEYMKGLAALIQEQGIPEHNGMYIRNREQFDSWSLDAKYASGEKLSLSAYGRPALECPFSIYEFLKYADEAAGFTEAPEERNAEILDRVQGHWVDLNGDTTLDFEGNRMTISFSVGDAEEYEVRAGGTRENPTIENTAEEFGGSFMIMSEISVRDDGTLTAYEMVLDADGHTFRFVREENLEKERAVEDLSEDLPKVIASGELESFGLYFGLGDTRFDVPEDSPWQSGCTYIFEITKNDDGAYEMAFEAMGDSYVLTRFRETVSEEYVTGLASLIQEQKIPEHNGMHLMNNEAFGSWSLEAEYASGEYLSLSASGRPALECPFSINAFLEYANRTVEM